MPTHDVRLDFRKESIELADGEIVYKYRWVLQKTNPLVDLWQSCELFISESEALNDFQIKSYMAGYDNLTIPTGE